MAVSIEDILLARSISDSEQRVEPGEAAIIGAGLEGAAGIGYTDLAARLRPQTQMDIMPPRGYRLKPGHRMAGGLVGAILGGALGAGTAAMMKQNSPAANVLANFKRREN